MAVLPDGNDGPETKPGASPRETGSAPSSTSPLRWLLVIVPLLIIAFTGTNLLSRFMTPSHEAAREERKIPEETSNPFPPELNEAAPSAPTPLIPSENADAFDAKIVVAFVAGADAETGARTFRMCAPCHTSEKNAPAMIGPNLWGIVGRPKAALPDYVYSQALKAKGGAWSYAELAQYLHNPRKFAPGTSMTFRGIAENQKLANLLAYMRTLADVPAPPP